MSQLTPDETLLGLIAARPQHGYELQQYFLDPARLGQVWNLSTSQLYAVLKRLERAGLTVGHEVAPPDAPPRIEYAITEAGSARLLAWLNDAAPSPSVRRVRVEFLSRLYVARLLNLPTGQVVRSQAAACRRERTELVAHRDQASPGVGYLALELAVAQLDAILHWLERCELIDTESDMP